jgi:hypothetical protein
MRANADLAGRGEGHRTTCSRVRQIEAGRRHFLALRLFDTSRRRRLPSPGRKRLGTSGTVHEGKTLLYRASKLNCDICPLKPQCCPKEPSRKIPRDIQEHAQDLVRSLAGTEGFEKSRHDRKKTEMRFAHLKRILKLGDHVTRRRTHGRFWNADRAAVRPLEILGRVSVNGLRDPIVGRFSYSTENAFSPLRTQARR